VPQAQRARLDEDGPRGRAHLSDDGVQGPGRPARVPALDHVALHAVARGAPPELGARRKLLGGRRRVSVAVVLDHEHDRQRQERGEVQRLVHVARARRAVAEEREPDGLAPEAALGVGGPEDGPAHGAQVADHGERAVGGVAVVDVALPRAGRAVGVREVLVQVLAEVAAPDEVPAEAAVGEGDHVQRLVREEREGDDHPLVALAARHRPADQPLAKELEDPVVGDPGELHPGVDPQEGLVRPLVQVRRAQVARL